jgi:hypothetical protein
MSPHPPRISLYDNREMNRQLRNERRRRWARRGGGYAQTGSLMPIPADDWTFAVKDQVTMPYNDCASTMRPGQLVNQPNPELAQVAMAGGRRSRVRKQKQRGGACGCMQRGGSRRQRGGGVNGFSVNVDASIGGVGPNVAPVYAGVPCDVRAGTPNPNNAGGLGADPRAPADLYSLTPNVQRGGAYSSGNAYDASCYRAPGSELPVYNAESAGFRFEPSTASGATLPDGVTAYNNVVPYAARLSGGRRRSSHRRRNSRRAAKKSYRRRH